MSSLQTSTSEAFEVSHRESGEGDIKHRVGLRGLIQGSRSSKTTFRPESRQNVFNLQIQRQVSQLLAGQVSRESQVADCLQKRSCHSSWGLLPWQGPPG